MSEPDAPDYGLYVQAMHDLCRSMIELSQIDPPRLEIPENTSVSDLPEIEWDDIDSNRDDISHRWGDILSDTDYLTTCGEIVDIIEEYTDNYSATIGQEMAEDHREIILSVDAQFLVDGDAVAHLGVNYFDSSDIFMAADYNLYHYNRSQVGLFDGFISDYDIDPVDLSRQIVSIELAHLAYKTGSAAATLDYWQTEQGKGWYQQTDWADIRGVNRQTVNDRVRQAKQALDRDE